GGTAGSSLIDFPRAGQWRDAAAPEDQDPMAQGQGLALGGGVAMKVSDKVQLHADLDYSHGDKIKQPWGVNIGATYAW
ncbi:hypothetical protein B1218_27075, partial [Pseudomonas ogarae]